MMPLRAPLIWLASAALVSCVSTTLETSSNHPANPPRATAPPPKAADPLSPGFDPFAAYPDDAAAPQSGAGHERHGAPVAPLGASTFTCPMHPEIVRDAPGSCPICGMKLVPKKSETAPKPPDHSGH